MKADGEEDAQRRNPLDKRMSGAAAKRVYSEKKQYSPEDRGDDPPTEVDPRTLVDVHESEQLRAAGLLRTGSPDRERSKNHHYPAGEEDYRGGPLHGMTSFAWMMVGLTVQSFAAPSWKSFTVIVFVPC